MYQQPNHSYSSTDSFKRISSNNPFRQFVDQPTTSSTIQQQHHTSTSTTTSNRSSNGGGRRTNTPPNFDEWVQKNKQLLDLSDGEEEDDDEDDDYGFAAPQKSNYNYKKPQMPSRPVRAGSDSSINYGKKANNPFASPVSDDKPTRHDVPRQHTPTQKPPSRPPKPDNLPSYEEAAGPKATNKEYPSEKPSSSSSSGNHSSSNRSRSHRHASDRHTSSEKSGSDRSKTSSSSSGSRHHSSRHHSSSRNKSPSKKKPAAEPVKAKNLDTIDKLDVTAFFGGGFHHDGPFDACTPHRNKNTKVAPVAAFPIDGPNNSIKGLGGNIDKNEQMNLAFGTYDEDQNEIIGRKGPDVHTHTTIINGNNSNSNNYIQVPPHNDIVVPPPPTPTIKIDPSSSIYTQNPSVIDFNANIKAQPIHGEISQGLGSTTFLDGAPASRAAETHEYYASINNGGLGRKKSIVQRLRKNSATSENTSRRNSNDNSNEFVRRGSLNNNNSKSLSTDELKPASTTGSGNGGTASSLIRRVKSLKVRR
ncbi:Pal1 cell morphology protein-domain-containing protein [Scheffersomyces coipomensis]|uniref:Pal1 cell morphology protein-domain-containing protein n=1 Tax=Scheffersomyces coipomensis TaxID=1788519 RepID=UPI00315CB62F